MCVCVFCLFLTSLFIFIFKKNQISNILISLMSHYVYMFLKSQTFALFILSRPYSTSSIIYPITIIPSLFPSFSLHFSRFLPHSRSNPKCALLVQHSLYCQHISHGSDVALHSILYRICHAKTLQDINIYSSAPHHCCLKLHLLHTLSNFSQILSLSSPRFIFCLLLFFWTHILHLLWLSISPTHLGWVATGEKDRKSTSERLIHENQRAKSPSMKKELIFTACWTTTGKEQHFLAATDGIFRIKKAE